MRVELFEGDFNEKCKAIADKSIRLMFADPPYHEKYKHLYEEMMNLGARVVCDGGYLATYCSEDLDYKYEVIRYAKKAGLTPCIEIVVILSGNGGPLHKQKSLIKHKSLLLFTKGKSDAINYIPNVIRSQKPDKEIHDWEQSVIEAKHCIEYLTVEGETVLDCMMGSGTTIIAALELGRKAKGVDIDPVAFHDASNRIANWIKESSA